MSYHSNSRIMVCLLFMGILCLTYITQKGFASGHIVKVPATIQTQTSTLYESEDVHILAELFLLEGTRETLVSGATYDYIPKLIPVSYPLHFDIPADLEVKNTRFMIRVYLVRNKDDKKLLEAETELRGLSVKDQIPFELTPVQRTSKHLVSVIACARYADPQADKSSIITINSADYTQYIPNFVTNVDYYRKQFGFTWSPNGTKIAYVRAADKADCKEIKAGFLAGDLICDNEIFICNIDGTNNHRLVSVTSGNEMGGFPAWSPDGKMIAFNFGDEIFVIDAEGGYKRKLISTKPAFYPAWSPDGQRIAYESEGAIYITNITGNENKKVFSSPTDKFGQPAWAPDGNRIAFINVKGTPGFRRGPVLILDLKSNQSKTVDASGCNPSWSPDGKFLVFADRIDGAWTIQIHDLTFRTKSFVYKGASLCFPRWSPVPIMVEGHNEN